MPNDIGVDWHTKVPPEPCVRRALKMRLQRALSMAKRTLDMDNLKAYDEWIAEAAELRSQLGD